MTSFKSPTRACSTQCPQPCSRPPQSRIHQRLLDTHGQVGAGLSWGHCSFLLGPGVHKVLFVPTKSPFPQSRVKFWQLCGGVYGDLLQEGSCHT